MSETHRITPARKVIKKLQLSKFERVELCGDGCVISDETARFFERDVLPLLSISPNGLRIKYSNCTISVKLLPDWHNGKYLYDTSQEEYNSLINTMIKEGYVISKDEKGKMYISLVA